MQRRGWIVEEGSLNLPAGRARHGAVQRPECASATDLLGVKSSLAIEKRSTPSLVHVDLPFLPLDRSDTAKRPPDPIRFGVNGGTPHSNLQSQIDVMTPPPRSPFRPELSDAEEPAVPSPDSPVKASHGAEANGGDR